MGYSKNADKRERERERKIWHSRSQGNFHDNNSWQQINVSQYDSQITGLTYSKSSLLNASSNRDAVAILNTPLHDHVIFIQRQFTQIDSMRPKAFARIVFRSYISYCIYKEICEVKMVFMV